jgi:hypothetical protein
MLPQMKMARPLPKSKGMSGVRKHFLPITAEKQDDCKTQED